jgi:hypothetical protein
MITDGYKQNFLTLSQAFEDGNVCLMECTDAATGKPVYTICAVNREPTGEMAMVPMARLFDGNPYEELMPPEVPA